MRNCSRVIRVTRVYYRILIDPLCSMAPFILPPLIPIDKTIGDVEIQDWPTDVTSLRRTQNGVYS